MAAYRTKMPLAQYGWYLVLFAVLSTLVHSAACVINDICDRELDKQVLFLVERTKNRPLSSGAISVGGAVVCLFVECAICIGVLASTKDLFIFCVGLFGIFPLHGLYPLMKRFTYWPQAWLGLALNWGYILVWLKITVSPYWTIIYDTIYGCLDRVDDVKAGIKSTSLLFGIFATGFVAAIAVAGFLNMQSAAYYLVSVGGTALHLAWQLITLRDNDPEDCLRKFQSNGNLGYIVMAGMLIDYLQIMY
ncbi:UbiA prenyltransferase [Pholiota conissans]|uniref:UbiA prenyltransferase n=1 Tax=Pholiota conissans TaxID=109636 RepID=A0A9P5Z1E4_9AGAR|nr:UbiA prenyltransferase [Pholiota conissans]